MINKIRKIHRLKTRLVEAKTELLDVKNKLNNSGELYKSPDYGYVLTAKRISLEGEIRDIEARLNELQSNGNQNQPGM